MKNRSETKYFNILEIPLIIVKRLPFILAFLFIALLLSVIYTGRLKERFMSFVEIEFRSGQKYSSSGMDILNVGTSLYGPSSYNPFSNTPIREVDIYAHIARTPRIIDNIILKNDLKEIYKISTMKGIRQRFLLKVRISINDLGLLEISYSDEDKYLAYDVIRSYIEELDNYYIWRSRAIMKSSLAEINSIFEQVNEEISIVKIQLKEFQEKHGIFNVDKYAESLAEHIADLRMQSINAQLEYKTKYLEYKTLGNITSKELSVYKEKINIINKELDTIKNITERSNIAYNDIPKINLEYMQIDINLRSLYTIYEKLKLYYNMNKLNINKEVETMVIVTEPEIAEVKYYPYRSRLVIKHLVIAFFFSIFATFFVEFFLRSFKNEDDREILLEIIDNLLFWKKWNIFKKLTKNNKD